MTSELETAGLPQRGPAIPLAVKLVYTAWMAVWLTVYWQQYGPSTLLWLCDFANLATLVAIWLKSPLLLSSQLVAVAVPQLGWTIDWVGRLVLGFHPIGGTEYMFDVAKPWWLRALSFFHLWMLPLLVWLVRRTGYDRRGVWVQSALMGAVLLPLSWLVGAREENFNWVWGLFGKEQTWMPAGAWFACLLVLYPLVLFLPAHWIASKTLAPPPARPAGPPEASHASAQRAADAAGIPELTRPTARS
jgi:hypothetical protein